MKRVVKDPEIRRLEILSAAEKLFAEHGYENTPVEAIIREAGIAKGTFYYYFKAKKDILAALVEKIGAELTAYFQTVMEQENISALKKLKLMFVGEEKQQRINPPIMEVLHKPENRELQERLNIYTIEVIAPVIGKVIEQGKEEGIFKTTISSEGFQIILAGAQFILDSGLFDLTPKKRMSYQRALQKLAEIAIGVKPGTLGFITKK